MNSDEKVFRKSIGNKIKLARANTDYTQEKLAEKLSLSSKYISQLERGQSFGSASTIINICKALHINSNFLFDDLINVNIEDNSTFIDSNFFKTYLQLNNYNKTILHLLATQLVHLQNTNKADIKSDIKDI